MSPIFRKELILVSLAGTIVIMGLGFIIPLFPIYIAEKGASNFGLGLLLYHPDDWLFLGSQCQRDDDRQLRARISLPGGCSGPGFGNLGFSIFIFPTVENIPGII